MRRGGWLAVVVALVLFAGACSSDRNPTSSASTSSTTARRYSGDAAAFYDVPSPLPGTEHGDLIKYQELADVDGGHTYRVMYRSTSTDGKPIAVTGLVAVPTAPGTDRVVLSWAHGTAGIADRCAPSMDPSTAFNPLMQQFLDRGWVVVATDYEGLGTPGRHPYLAGVSEGRGTLDIIRAVHQIPEANAGERALVWGHSQGGHAALWAAQLAPTWTPEVHVLGTVAGAPPSELPLIATALQGGDYQGYLALAAAGLNAAYPRARLDELLTPKGVDLLPVVDRECTDGVFAAFNGINYRDFVRVDPTSLPDWRTVLDESDPGHEKLAMPLLIIHGLDDQQIPPIVSELLFNRLCGLGQTVERRTYAGVGHAEVIAPSFADMVRWMDDRVDGKPAASTCPAS